MPASSARSDIVLSGHVKNAAHAELVDIGSVFRADQQAFLDHHETQLSKMLNTVTERLGSLKLTQRVRIGFFFTRYSECRARHHHRMTLLMPEKTLINSISTLLFFPLLLRISVYVSAKELQWWHYSDPTLHAMHIVLLWIQRDFSKSDRGYPNSDGHPITRRRLYAIL